MFAHNRFAVVSAQVKVSKRYRVDSQWHPESGTELRTRLGSDPSAGPEIVDQRMCLSTCEIGGCGAVLGSKCLTFR